MMTCLAACLNYALRCVAWCNANQGFCMVVLTVVLAYCAWKSCQYAANNIKAIKEIEENRSRPQIVLEIVPDIPFYIVRMVNLGLTAAHNIVVEVEPRLTYCFDRWQGRKIGFLENGVKMLVPRAFHQTNIGSFHDIEKINKTLVFKGIISYQGPDGKAYRDPFVLDFALYQDTVYSGKKTIDNIGSEIEKLRRVVESFGSGSNKLRVIAQSLDDYRAEEKALVDKILNSRRAHNDEILESESHETNENKST